MRRPSGTSAGSLGSRVGAKASSGDSAIQRVEDRGRRTRARHRLAPQSRVTLMADLAKVAKMAAKSAGSGSKLPTGACKPARIGTRKQAGGGRKSPDRKGGNAHVSVRHHRPVGLAVSAVVGLVQHLAPTRRSGQAVAALNLFLGLVLGVLLTWGLDCSMFAAWGIQFRELWMGPV